MGQREHILVLELKKLFQPGLILAQIKTSNIQYDEKTQQRLFKDFWGFNNPVYAKKAKMLKAIFNSLSETPIHGSRVPTNLFDVCKLFK